ncbi:MAG: methyltransferase domain-containing protein [Elusimicrobia bacterium]|nr:methyltransferase domain-containing protein [Elusimicrobiota bacterium]
MPIGNAYATGTIIAFIEQYHLKNKTLNVLDVGCGIGHNGFVFREMFEIRYARLKPEEWMHHITAIEIFQGYKNPTWDYVYNTVIIGNCLTEVPYLKNERYDIIFATEILEHLERKDMYSLLDELLHMITDDGSIIITIPVADKEAFLSQKDLFGNINETHKNYVTIKDFKKYYIKHAVNDGIFMIGKNQ